MFCDKNLTALGLKNKSKQIKQNNRIEKKKVQKKEKEDLGNKFENKYYIFIYANY